MEAKDMVLKFYEFYGRKPREEEFEDFMDKEELNEFYMQYGYNLDSYINFIKVAFRDTNATFNRVYNVYDWDGNYKFHGTLDDINAHFGLDIYDLPALKSIKDVICVNNYIETDKSKWLIVGPRPYNRGNFIEHCYSNTGYEKGAVSKEKMAKFRKEQLTCYGYRKKSHYISGNVKDLLNDGLVMGDYKKKIETFLDLYCRFPSNEDLKKIGVDSLVFSEAGITNRKKLAQFYGYKPITGTKTYGVYDNKKNEVFRGTMNDVMKEYNVSADTVKTRRYFNDDKEKMTIKIISFNIFDFVKAYGGE